MKRAFTTERYETFAEANERARELGAQFYAHKSYYVFKPYCVDMLPQIGEPVSKAFNGDYYPCGYITSVSKTGAKVTTSTGDVFNRQRNRIACWVAQGGTFSMVFGHHDERNVHF